MASQVKEHARFVCIPFWKANLLLDLGRIGAFGGKGVVVGSRLQRAAKHREAREWCLQTQFTFAYHENEDEDGWGDF